MLRSRIEICNGKPFILINDELHYPLAYTTYFEDCGQFHDFINNGYRMFFINVSFTDLPINNMTGFTPFRTGIFEGDTPDYNEFDSVVKKIVSECPDALIFPRIHVAMPRKWVAANPYETVETMNGGNRESLFSDLYRHDGAELLRTLIGHIRSSSYAHRIAGYHVCGGTTQEWMHHDLFGSFSEMGIEKFRKWMQEKYNRNDVVITSKEDFSVGTCSEKNIYYAEFSNETVAKTAEHFAKVVKECTNNEQIVGIFYGYNAFVDNYMFGLHGLRHIINSPYIDFFSSPCCYDATRELGVDWGDMIPVDSLKANGKLAFIECDIRTYLTRQMTDSRPGEYPDNIMKLTDENGNRTVWKGPETPELSLSAIRKAFAHQITRNSGVWWFDMWGGWYHDDSIMADMKKMKHCAENSIKRNPDEYPHAQTVLFIDERAYANVPRHVGFEPAVNAIRVAMGNTGIPFDLCMVEDAPKVIDRYKAAIFTAPMPSEVSEEAMNLCREKNIPFISSGKEKISFSTEELRDFLTENSIHCYNDENNVIYAGNGFVGIHSKNDGETSIKLPGKFTIIPLFGTDIQETETDTIKLSLKKHDTVIFELRK